MTRIRLHLVTACIALAISLCSVHADWQWANDAADASETPDTYEASFNFRNTGPNELKVEDMSSCCNCTSFTFKTKPAAPGAEGSVTITIDRKKSKSSKTSFVFLVTAADATPTSLLVLLKKETP